MALIRFAGRPNLQKRSGQQHVEILENCSRYVLEDWNDCSLRIRIVANESSDGTEKCLTLVDGVCSDTTPDLSIDTSWMCLRPHPRNDGELVASASESPPQIGIGGTSSVDGCAIGKDRLELVDVVAGETLQRFLALCHSVRRKFDIRIAQSNKTSHLQGSSLQHRCAPVYRRRQSRCIDH